MGYEVRLTAKARGDLNEIVAYIAQDNPLAAEKLGDELACPLILIGVVWYDVVETFDGWFMAPT
jgi:hypothetical protein